MIRINCTLQFSKPSEADRDNISALKNAIVIGAQANNLDVRIIEERDYGKPKPIPWALVVMFGFCLVIIIMILAHFCVQAV